MNAKNKPDPLVVEMDDFAATLLKGAKAAKVTAQHKIDVFRAVREWVGVKNRLTEPSAEGTDLDAIRSRLYGESETDRGAAGGAKQRPGGHARVKWGNQYPDGTGGSALEAIKRALPRSNAGDVDGGGGNPEC